MECAKRGAANGHSPWQAERQSRPPGKRPGLGLAQRSAGRGASCRKRHCETGRHCCRSRTPSFADRVAAAVPLGCGKLRRLHRCAPRHRSQATTFVARLATIRILPATRFTKDLIRGSLSVSCPGEFLAAAVASLHRDERLIEQEGIKDKDKRI